MRNTASAPPSSSPTAAVNSSRRSPPSNKPFRSSEPQRRGVRREKPKKRLGGMLPPSSEVIPALLKDFLCVLCVSAVQLMLFPLPNGVVEVGHCHVVVE